MLVIKYKRKQQTQQMLVIKVHKTYVFGVSEKPSQSKYDDMLEAVKLLTMSD